MKKEFADTMQPGIKYSGYGMLNAFREFMFIPSQKGANAGRMQIVRQGDGWSVHSTRDNIVIHFKLPRKSKPLERIADFLRLQQQVVSVLKEYDLSKKPTEKTKKK